MKLKCRDAIYTKFDGSINSKSFRRELFMAYRKSSEIHAKSSGASAAFDHIAEDPAKEEAWVRCTGEEERERTWRVL
jgi:hypothetical protein